MKSIYITCAAMLLTFAACTDYLDEQVYTQYDPESFLNTEAGINAVLTATYRLSRPNYREAWFSFAGWNTDLQLERGGGYAAPAATFAGFQWQPSNNFFTNNWRGMYEAIRNANSLLDNIDKATSVPAEKIATLKAEAVFLRAYNYYTLYDFFGPVPLVTSAKDPNFEITRATDEEMKFFLESELRSAAEALPVDPVLSGKATRGAAMALLGRFFLNTKQWQACADVLEEVITLNKYQLFRPVEGLFSIENETNDELIFVFESLAIGPGWNYMPHAYRSVTKPDK